MLFLTTQLEWVVSFWAAFLADFLPGVLMVHTKGKDHLVPDALFYIPAPLFALMTSSFCPMWLTDIHIAQERDSSLEGYRQLAQQGRADFHSEGPLLMFKGRLVIPNDKVIDVLREMHDKHGYFE